MQVGQLVWVNLKGKKGAGRITKQDTDGVTVHYLQSGRDDATVPRKNIEVMDEPALLSKLTLSPALEQRIREQYDPISEGIMNSWSEPDG